VQRIVYSDYKCYIFLFTAASHLVKWLLVLCSFRTGCLVEGTRSFIIIYGSICNTCCCIGTWVLGSLAVTLRPQISKIETSQKYA